MASANFLVNSIWNAYSKDGTLWIFPAGMCYWEVASGINRFQELPEHKWKEITLEDLSVRLRIEEDRKLCSI